MEDLLDIESPKKKELVSPRMSLTLGIFSFLLALSASVFALEEIDSIYGFGPILLMMAGVLFFMGLFGENYYLISYAVLNVSVFANIVVFELFLNMSRGDLRDVIPLIVILFMISYIPVTYFHIRKEYRTTRQ